MWSLRSRHPNIEQSIFFASLSPYGKSFVGFISDVGDTLSSRGITPLHAESICVCVSNDRHARTPLAMQKRQENDWKFQAL